jgi:hypothetical protein
MTNIVILYASWAGLSAWVGQGEPKEIMVSIRTIIDNKPLIKR